MLTLFPQILFLAPFSGLLLRIAVAVALGYSSWKHSAIKNTVTRILSAIEIFSAVLILVGAWTQAAAALAICVAIVWIAVPSKRTLPLSTAILILVMTLCLVISGAGLFAFDLPL